MKQCAICKQFYNPEMLSEVFEHCHTGISTDKEYFGIEVGRFKKVHHVNPNCKDATKCEPHGEVGEVVNND